jgi:acyl carrier protein
MGWIRRMAQSWFEAESSSPEAAENSPAAEAKSPERASEADDTIVGELRRQVVELSNGELPEQAIDASAPLLDYGYVDSLSAVTLIHFVEERYGVSVSEIDLIGSLNSLEALARHIGSQTGASPSSDAHPTPPEEERDT